MGTRPLACPHPAVRSVEPTVLRFADDGVTPNNPRFPFVVFAGAFDLAEAGDPAASIEEVFIANGWGSSWRNGIYAHLHYHAAIHEVLAVARGSALVRFGGDHGRDIALGAGDVAVLPAGTGHQRLEASRNFLVVGAYPRQGTYDVCRGSAAERERALLSIPQVSIPDSDPVYGLRGPLIRLWQPEKD